MNKTVTRLLQGLALLLLMGGAGTAFAGGKTIPMTVTVTNVNRCEFATADLLVKVDPMLVPDGDDRTSSTVAVGIRCTRPLAVQLQISLQGHANATLTELNDPAVTARIELKGEAGEWESMTPERVWNCTNASQCDLQLRAKVRAGANASSGEKSLAGTLLLTVKPS